MSGAEDDVTEQERPYDEDLDTSCPICTGGFGLPCNWHFL